MKDVYSVIEDNIADHIETIREFIRMPSVSLDGTGMSETAEKVKDLLQELGAQAEIVPTQGYPIVYGELDLGRPKTVLVYGMYDVMPVEGEEWIVPPFSADIIELPGLGPCIVGRGICNSKGPLKGLLNAIAVLKELEQIPVNLKFVIEGEEELGSIHLPRFVEQYRERLINCDAAFSPFFSLNRRGRPVMYLGFKGILKLELVCQGGDWGGPRTSGIHSMHGAWIASPLWKLVHALSSMVDEDESITIRGLGLGDEVAKPNAEQEALLAGLSDIFDEATILEETDVACFKYQGLHGTDLLRKYLFSPAVNIDGIFGGHTGEGIKTVIGHRAVAKMDIRLVPNMTCENTLTRVQEHLARHGFGDIRVVSAGGYECDAVSVGEPVVQALLCSYRDHGFGECEIWPFIGGSAPTYLFTRELGIPLIMGGLCHGGNVHVANEYARADQIGLYEKSVASFLIHFAADTPDNLAKKEE